MSLKVCEIFFSIQGESTFSGRPCIFIRLTGCNLNCTWCDTPYAREEGSRMTLSKIMEAVAAFLPCRLVEITGGEPLIQEKAPELISKLVESGFTVLLETNGSQSIEKIHPECIRIIDIKGPSSGEADSFLWKNLEWMTPADEIKFVIGSRSDYETAKTIIQHKLPGVTPAGNIHLSPVPGRIRPDRLAAWVLEDKLDARLSLQLHKIIWNPEMRGV